MIYCAVRSGQTRGGCDARVDALPAGRTNPSAARSVHYPGETPHSPSLSRHPPRVIDLGKADAETFTCEDIRYYLSSYHDLERIEMEVAQLDRLREVLSEMQRRCVAVEVDDGWRLRG